MKKLFRQRGKTKSTESSEQLEPKKQKEKRSKANRQIPFSRRKVSRLAAILLFSVIGLSLLFNIIFFTKYQAIRNSAKAAEKQIEQQLGKVRDSDLLNSQSAVIFTEDFLRQYFYIPSDKEDRGKRADQLQEYFVSGFDVGGLENLNDFGGERTVRSMRFLENERLNANQAKIYFIVSYEITEIKIVEETVKKKKKVKEDGKKVEKEVEEVVQKEEPKTIQNIVEIGVPVTTNGKGFAVYDYPTIENRNLKGNVNYEEQELKGEDLTPTERDALQDFLKDFFTSYGVSDEKLPFMAKMENGLSNQVLQTVSIRDSAKRDGTYQVIVDVQFQNSETSLSSFYAYHLTLEKDKNTFFITHME